MKGLYDTNTPRHISDLCLNEEISGRISDMIYVIEERDYFLIFNFFRDLMAVIANVEECGLEKSILEIETFCKKHDCSAPVIFGGIAPKFF